MPEENRTYNVSKADVDRLGEKLTAFAETLSEQDRDVLTWIVAQAAAAGEQEEEVSGYMVGSPGSFGMPFSNQIGRAVGLRRPGGLADGGGQVSIQVQWQR